MMGTRQMIAVMSTF